jgi:lipocalin
MVNSKNITNFELSKYMGTWYQIYTNEFVESSILRYGKCITANYTIKTNNSFNIYSEMILDNRIISITGIGIITNRIEPNKIDIIWDYGADGENWIYDIGPEYNNLYDYAIISDSNKISLFIIIRNVERYFNLYNNTVFEYLNNNNFLKPILIDQNNCKE